jgi:uncharacterized protein YjbJ (UPF0337 family)
MIWEHLQGGWKQVTGKTKEQWGKLTHDDFAIVAGRLDQIAGRRQLRLDVADEAAVKRLAAWARKAGQSWLASGKKNN